MALARRYGGELTLFDVVSDYSWPMQYVTGAWEQTLEELSGHEHEQLVEARAELTVTRDELDATQKSLNSARRRQSRLLESIPFPYPVVPIVKHHHERWDGRGYPDGIRAERIPRGARVLAAVDAYDAITSDRPYRKAVSQDDAVAFLQRESGRRFDPRVVGALVVHWISKK